MISESTTTTRLVYEDHEQVMSLFQQRPRQHIHLDWKGLAAWLSDPSLHCWIRRENGRVESLIGATVYLPPAGQGEGVAWLRLILPATPIGFDPSLETVWQALCQDLSEAGVKEVALLELDPWIAGLGVRWGFKRANAIVTMRREGGHIPAPPKPPLRIRDASLSDLDRAVEVDAAAFEPIWRYDLATLEAAYPHAATFTLLEREGELLGYQLSTRHGHIGHLTRLAIIPQAQGQGLGGLLVGEMFRYFAGLGITTLTVNTQEDNYRSQRLYRRLGFEFIGSSVPVWTLRL